MEACTATGYYEIEDANLLSDVTKSIEEECIESIRFLFRWQGRVLYGEGEGRPEGDHRSNGMPAALALPGRRLLRSMDNTTYPVSG
jgi:hypothetical protein